MDQRVKFKQLKDFYSGKKILITGHTGFKGSWMCFLLNKMEADIYGYALEPPTKPSLYKLISIGKICESTIADIRNYEKLKQKIESIKPEIVIHMAAQSLVRESYNNPKETYEVNVIGTVNLFEAIRHVKGIKAIVNVTSDKCYQNRDWHWGYRENEPMGGYDPYSNSKGCSELVTSSYRYSFFNPKEYSKHGLALASARAGNVIGGGDWAANRLIPDFIRAVLRKEKIRIRCPFSIRPWQHVFEPLTGYMMLAKKLYEEGTKYANAWNFGPDASDERNVKWIIEFLCRIWGNGASYEIDEHPQPYEVSYLKLDCSKAKAELQWVPRWNIETALEMVVNWTKAFQNEKDLEAISNQQIEVYFD